MQVMVWCVGIKKRVGNQSSELQSVILLSNIQSVYSILQQHYYPLFVYLRGLQGLIYTNTAKILDMQQAIVFY